jgi:hypothetical protein
MRRLLRMGYQNFAFCLLSTFLDSFSGHQVGKFLSRFVTIILIPVTG